jgi:Lrp/AsnC family transcriptional regulator, leucine-responsive regulatory protein
MIDDIDRTILTILQQNARTAAAEIARQVGLAPSAVFERIRKLEERGIIESYTVRLGSQVLGLGQVAFVFVRAEERAGAPNTGKALAAMPEVLEVHHVAGEDCFLLKVRASDTEAIGRLLNQKLGAIRTVQSTRTTIVLGTLKETSALPLPPAAVRASGRSK